MIFLIILLAIVIGLPVVGLLILSVIGLWALVIAAFKALIEDIGL